jgi:hypothetical protein
MQYQVSQRVDELEFRRHHTREVHYIGELREKELLLEIDNVAVDAEQLVLRTFQCNTNYCVKCSGMNGTKEYKGSCCTDLSVDLTDPEKEKLVEMARLAKQRLRFEPRDPIGRIVELLLMDEFSETNDEHEDVLRHRSDGRCIMSWIEEGTLRCSINTLCHRLGLSVEEFKPDPCYLFPLHYSEYSRNRFLLSILCEETRYWIGQHACVGKLACLRKPEKGAPPAYVYLRGEIEHIFGKQFYLELDRQAQPILENYSAEKVAVNGKG